MHFDWTFAVIESREATNTYQIKKHEDERIEINSAKKHFIDENEIQANVIHTHDLSARFSISIVQRWHKERHADNIHDQYYNVAYVRMYCVVLLMAVKPIGFSMISCLWYEKYRQFGSNLVPKTPISTLSRTSLHS